MQYNAIVKNIKEITSEIKLFVISFKDGHKLNYKAGQFAVLSLPEDKNNLDGKWITRAYSITSAPSKDDVEFYIVLVENGQLTSRLWDLKVGDDIYMGEKVAGLMNFDNVSEDSNIIFISTGTGIAPFISILKEHKDFIFNGKRQIALLHGARHTYELGFKGELEELSKEHPEFNYFPVVSKSDNEVGVVWNGYKGHVQSLIKDGTLEKKLGIKIDPETFHVFLCGNQRMVDEVVELFNSKNFTKNTVIEKGNLYFDKH